MNEASAVVLADDLFRTPYAKTAHGLVRGPSRWPIRAVVDASCAGSDAGALLDGRPRGIPVVDSVASALELPGPRPRWCVVGVATSGGVLPAQLRQGLVQAASAGLSLVSGLHQLLRDDEELARLVREHGQRIVDVRAPRPVRELRFWTGDVLELAVPRVAVLGTDCALGKRTTCQLLRAELQRRGVRAAMVHTGQTGWLQGNEHGFVLDATPNDFVSGELERAILACAQQLAPDVILIEGQSALRNPSGPCGAELLLSAGARHAVLQHAPHRRCFEGLEARGCAIPPLRSEIGLIGCYGAEVVAVTLNGEGLTPPELAAAARRIAGELGIPVCAPLLDGVGAVAEAIVARVPTMGKP
jgi:uncharacterized NAD-dependent epimerase/dehydratase family protein